MMAICDVCGKEFEPPCKRGTRRKTCSDRCWLKYHNKKPRNIQKALQQEMFVFIYSIIKGQSFCLLDFCLYSGKKRDGIIGMWRFVVRISRENGIIQKYNRTHYTKIV